MLLRNNNYEPTMGDMSVAPNLESSLGSYFWNRQILYFSAADKSDSWPKSGWP